MPFQRGTENKTAQLRIRFTPTEKAQAEAHAAEAGLTLSAYLRRRALGQPMRSKSDLATISELRRLGGLLKHIHNTSDGMYGAETSMALAAIIDAVRRVGKP